MILQLILSVLNLHHQTNGDIKMLLVQITENTFIDVEKINSIYKSKDGRIEISVGSGGSDNMYMCQIKYEAELIDSINAISTISRPLVKSIKEALGEIK